MLHGIMLNAFATYYAHNYADIIGSSLYRWWEDKVCIAEMKPHNSGSRVANCPCNDNSSML